MKTSELVAGLSAAAEANDPLASVAATLRDVADARGAILDALSFMSGLGSDPEQSFYRSAGLSMLKVVFSPGRRTPPHDHGTWAAILLLAGREKNTLYRRRPDGELVQASEILLEPGMVLPMTAEAVHVAECVGETPAVGLHVYGGDLPALSTHIWDPDTFEEHPNDDALYRRFADAASAR